MKLFSRGLLVLLVFVAFGFVVARMVIAHAIAGGAPPAQVTLAGAMAGLFAGGAAASLLLLALAFGGRRR